MTMTRSKAFRFGAGAALALAMALPLGIETAHAGDAQFETPWQFTPRDRRVAIALAIKQVEEGLLGPSRSETHVENVVCNGPSGAAGATGNFFCEVVKGSDIQIGDRDQGNTGDQTATSNNSTNGNVNQSANTSRVDGVAAALQGRF